jgi:hypothetical protein
LDLQLQLQLQLQLKSSNQYRDRLAAIPNLPQASSRSCDVDPSANPADLHLSVSAHSAPLQHPRKALILVAGQLDVEIWNTELEITGTATSLPELQAISDEAFEPQRLCAQSAG